MELGAAVGNMDAFQGYGALAEKYGIIVNYDMVMKGGITVNLLGERFSNKIEDISGQVINVPADALVKTFASVERMVRGEIACPFGRSFAGNAPLSPPYHAISSTGALFHTQGGLQVDGDAQVVRADGTKLPNLFAGGGAARSISGGGPSGYLPAAGLCTAVTLGRLAGLSAAALSQSPR